jgi:hypothetical protein
MARPVQKPDLFSNLALAVCHLSTARLQVQEGEMENYTAAQREHVRTVCEQAQGLLDEVAALVVGASITDMDLTSLLGGDGTPS